MVNHEQLFDCLKEIKPHLTHLFDVIIKCHNGIKDDRLRKVLSCHGMTYSGHPLKMLVSCPVDVQNCVQLGGCKT